MGVFKTGTAPNESDTTTPGQVREPSRELTHDPYLPLAQCLHINFGFTKVNSELLGSARLSQQLGNE